MVRQGQFGIYDDEITKMRIDGFSAEEIKILRGSKINMGTDTPMSKSVFQGEITEDIGSSAYRDRHGLYSEYTDFVEVSKIKPSATYITNRAPPGRYFSVEKRAMVTTKGGAMQVMVEKSDYTSEKLLLLERDGGASSVIDLINRNNL